MKTFPFLLATGIAATVMAGPYRLVVVDGVSMSPTLANHQLLFGQRGFGEIRRGDVVVAHVEGDTVVKRIAYLAGDRIPMYFANHRWRYATTRHEEAEMRAADVPRRDNVVPEGQVWLLGDNPGHSLDSRSYGPVAVTSISLKLDDEPGGSHPYRGIHYANRLSLPLST